MSKQFQHPKHLPPIVAVTEHPILNGSIMRRIVKLTGFVHGEVVLLAGDGVPALNVSMPLRAVAHFCESLGVVYANDLMGTVNAPGECAIIVMPPAVTQDIDLTLPDNAAVADSKQHLLVTLFDQASIEGTLLGTGDKFLGKSISLGAEAPQSEEDRARAALDLARENDLSQATANAEGKLKVVPEPGETKVDAQETEQATNLEPSTDLQTTTETTTEVAPAGEATGDANLTETAIPQEAEPILSAEAGHDASESTATLKEEV